MLAVNSTDVRKEWGGFVDKVVRQKPVFVKRSRDFFLGISVSMLSELLDNIKFEFSVEREDDGSYTLDMNNFDIAVNADSYETALELLLLDFKEYCLEYYHELDFYHSAPNRKAHFPYVLKALACNSDEELKKEFKCLVGQS